MSLDAPRNLNEFIQTCIYLSQDLEQAINDIDFKRLPDHKIYYAVDFSELYVYIFPSEASQDFVVFPDAFHNDDEKIAAKAIQQLILRYILFELDPQEIVLLHPYLLEFIDFVEKFKSNTFHKFIRESNLLYKGFQEITTKSIGEGDILRICQKAKNDTISSDEEKMLTSFIEDYGQFQSIIENIDAQYSSWERLNKLDPQHSFKKLDMSSLHLKEETNIEVYNRWMQRLDEIRQSEKARNKLDALAVQILFDVNRLWPSNYRLVLITRSKYMNSIYRQEYEEERWKETGDYYLFRHPRALSLVMPVELKDSQYDRDNLAHLLDIINNFLAKCSSSNLEDPNLECNLQKDIREIEEQWQKIQQYAITLGSSQHKPAEVTQSLAEQARIIMEGIRRLIQEGRLIKHLNAMISDLEEIHKSLQMLSQELPDGIKTLVDESDNDFYQFSLDYQFMPHKLHLESSDLVERVEAFFLIDPTSDDYHNFLRSIEDIEDYETRLVKAFLLGALGKWYIAELYCRDALNKEVTSENLNHEGKYWLAVCISQQKVSLDRLVEAYLLLDEIPNRPDVTHYSRYEILKGIIILKLHTKYDNTEQEIPSALVGLFVLDTEQNEIRNNVSLWLTVLKVKLDYFYSRGDIKNITNLEREWVESEVAFNNVEPISDGWSPNIVDAIAWGRWLLQADEYKSEEAHQSLLDMLHNVLKNSPPELEIHDEIKFHIREIQKETYP